MKRAWTGWRRLLGLPTRGRTSTRRQPGTRLQLEPLEDRTVPATVSIDGSGLLSYVAGAGVNNNLSISFDGNHTYTLTDSGETITASGLNALLMCRGSGTNTLTVDANSVFLPPFYHTPALSGMNVDLGDGSNTLNLQSNAVPINIDNTPGGRDVVGLGNGTMAGIQNNVSVENPSGSTSLTLDDSSDGLAHAPVVMQDGQLWGLQGGGIISWTPTSSPTGGVTSLAVYGGSGTNEYLVQNTSNLFAGTFLSTGTGGTTMNPDGVQVYATTGPLDIYNPGGQANVLLSNLSQSMANINGYVDVYGSGSTQLSLYDGSDTTAHTVSMYDGSLYGLAPAPIYWTPTSSSSGGVTYLGVQGSSGNDIFNVYNTSQFFYWTDLFTSGGTGTGNTSLVNVYATTGTLNVANPAGQSTTDIGLGSLASINGSVYVAQEGTGTTSLIVDDHLDSAARTATLTGTTLTGLGNPATIYYNEDVYYGYTGGVTSLTIDGGSGNNTYNVQSTAAGTPVTVNGGSGNDIFNVGNANSLNGIQGTLTINGGGGSNTLTANDSASASGQNYTLSKTALMRSGIAAINYASLAHLNVTASGNDTLALLNPVPTVATTFNGGSGTNMLQGANVSNSWTISGANSGKLDSVTFTNVQDLVGGTGLDTFKFSNTSGKVVRINGGGAPSGKGDWLDYTSLPSSSTVTVNLATGSATNVNGGATGAVNNIQNVLGSATGTNHLTGDAQGNILIGGSGANTLIGGSGNSLLIGGSGHGSITGDSGIDILIAGTTTYNATTAAGQNSLMAILAELQSADTFADKVYDLIHGTNSGDPAPHGHDLNGSHKLTWGGTVHASAGAFTLSGDASASSNPDWFFSNRSSTVTDFNDNGVQDEHNNNAIGVF